MSLVDDASNLLDDVIVKLDEIICSNLRWHCWELSWKWHDIDDDDFDDDDANNDYHSDPDLDIAVVENLGFFVKPLQFLIW